MFRFLKTAALAVVCWLMTAAMATADFIDTFDSYAPGVLAPQNGWQGWDGSPAAAGAVVTTVRAASGPNSVLVSGPDDLVHPFSEATSGQWRFSVKQYIPSSSMGETYAILMNRYRDNDYAYDDWAVQDSFNIDTGTVLDFQVTGNTLSLIKDQWVELKWEIDLNANEVKEYYGGTLLSTHVWTANGISGVGAVDLFANGAGAVYYDDLRLEPVPEPGTMALSVLAGAMLFGICLRRKSLLGNA